MCRADTSCTKLYVHKPYSMNCIHFHNLPGIVINLKTAKSCKKLNFTMSYFLLHWNCYIIHKHYETIAKHYHNGIFRNVKHMGHLWYPQLSDARAKYTRCSAPCLISQYAQWKKFSWSRTKAFATREVLIPFYTKPLLYIQMFLTFLKSFFCFFVQ